MDLEELILHYYLKVFNIILLIIFLFTFFYVISILNKKINLVDNTFSIEKGESFKSVLNKNAKDLNYIETLIINIYYKLYLFFDNKFIHFGQFNINNNISLNNLINIISKPSNVLNKLTIVEGWSKNDLNNEISKYFDDYYPIPYEDIIADTYFIEINQDFQTFHKTLIKIKDNYFKKYKNDIKFKNFTDNDIMIIGSLIEKEGLDENDKRNISSVIQNRLKNKMKLQIDATVIYSITDGKYNLNRKLLLSDLKVKHPFNTYINKGLPPNPISYVGKNTLDIIFQNHKTEFLFYFFDNSLNRHVFSINFEDHKKKLNEYRSSK